MYFLIITLLLKYGSKEIGKLLFEIFFSLQYAFIF